MISIELDNSKNLDISEDEATRIVGAKANFQNGLDGYNSEERKINYGKEGCQQVKLDNTTERMKDSDNH